MTESWSFIANNTGKKVLSLNEYSQVFYQNQQSELFKVLMAFIYVDRDLLELKLYCKYYRQKGFILGWIFKCVLSKPIKWNLKGMNGLYVAVLTEIFQSYNFITNTTCKKVLFLNEYSNVFYQNPQREIFKVWMIFRCVNSRVWSRCRAGNKCRAWKTSQKE